MNFRFTLVESNLNKAEFRWKWLRLLQHTFLLFGIIALLALLFGAAILAGWVTSKSAAIVFYSVLLFGGAIVWLIQIICVLAGVTDRHWLAASVERVDKRLLDRLNTLLFLEDRRTQPHAEAFALRIARQMQSLLARNQSPSPFKGSRALVHFGIFLALAITTGFLYYHYNPWGRLAKLGKNTAVAEANTPDKPLELTLPSTNNAEQSQGWGEIRITDPGTDIRVTKVDVVPLHIEAAANLPLKNVNWYSTVNGADESTHELDAPKEPRYAVYQPNVYLDELGLSDWDVMTYYAKANAEQDKSFASEVYFMEVRPFREDLMKMPGGEGGKAYETLKELTALIHQQQQVIRQTHYHVQRPPEQENLRNQDRKKLADAENDLGESTQHLYAKMASEMENKPIGTALDNLAKAEKSLNGAGKLLKENAMNEAPGEEREALADLVSARKAFQKSVSEHGSDFEDSDKKDEEEPVQVASSEKRINEIEEFRNEAKAAESFVQKMLTQQKNLEQKSRSAPRNDYPKLGTQEAQLEQSLKEFMRQHPSAFKGSEQQAKSAEDAMDKAAESLNSRNNDANAEAREATKQLEKFEQAMQGNSADRQLADAYKLKQMLDKEIQSLDKRAQPDSKMPDSELQKTAKEAHDTINELKKVAEQEPTRDMFGDPLRESLNGQNKVDLDAKLGQLSQDADPATRQQQAAESRDGLKKVSDAFGASQPKSMQMAQKENSLQPDGQDSFNQGMSELESLIKQAESGKSLSKSDKMKQGHEAMYNLQSGLRSYHGSNERGNQILLSIDKMLKAETPLEVENLKKLMDELQHFSVETSDKSNHKEDKPELSNIDPSRLPPAYRGRIQKYFQKLSEK